MINRVSSRWQAAILVCRKCEKRSGEKKFVKALRKRAGLKKGRKAGAGIVEVGCLGICPRRGITVVDSRKPGEWMVFRAGTPIAAVAAVLGLGPAGRVRPYSSNSSGNGSLPEIRLASASPSASE